MAAGGCLECYEDDGLAATWPASPRPSAAVMSPAETPRRCSADLPHSDRAAAHFSPRGSLLHPGAHPNAWDPVCRAAADARATAGLSAETSGSIETLGSEPSLRPAPSSYLDQLEEAISPRHDPHATLQLRPPPLSPAAAALAAAAAVAGGAPEAGPASPRAPAAAEAGCPLAALHWAGLEVALRVECERLSSVDVGLAACRIIRQVGGAVCAGAGTAGNGASGRSGAQGGMGSADSSGAAQGQGSGLGVGHQPNMSEVLALLPAAGVESAALTSAAGEPTALRVRWQPGHAGGQEQECGPRGAGPQAAAQPAVPAHLVSAHVGHLRAAYAPGFATCLAAFLNWPREGAAEQARGWKRARGAAPSLPTVAVPPAPAVSAKDFEPGLWSESGSGSGSGSALEWLSGRVSLGLSLLGMRLAALADGGRAPEAVLVAAERMSAHLGAMRPPARAGSLAAALWALPRWPAATGLRLSVRWRIPLGDAWSMKSVALSSLLCKSLTPLHPVFNFG